jgi:hypothetical protein
MPKGEPDQAEIDALAKDFADIESRVVEITRKTVRRLYWRFSLLAVVVPMLLGIGIAVWTIWFETGRWFSDRLDRDDQSISDTKTELARLSATAGPRADEFERELAHLRTEFEAVRKDLSDSRDRGKPKRELREGQ